MMMSGENRNRQEWPVQVFRYTLSGAWELIGNAPVLYSESALTATPNAGHIAIPRLKAKILIIPKENCAAAGNRISGGNAGCVMRRLDTISVPMQTGGVICLKFRNKEECIEFSDRLTAINPSKKENCLEDGGLSLVEEDEDNPVAKRRRIDTVSYVVRLLHDKDFMGFVDSLEDTLMSSEDGASILSALQRTGARDDEGNSGGDSV